MERWYTTDVNGEARVTAPSKPFVISVLHESESFNYLVSFNSCNAEERSAASYMHCLSVRNDRLTVDINNR